MGDVFRKVCMAWALLGLGLTGLGQTVNLICQNEIQSGEKLPVIIRFYTHHGQLDTSINQTVNLAASGAALSKPAVRVVRGVGSVITQVTASDDFTLSVSGFEGSKNMTLLSDRSYTAVSGRIDGARTWAAHTTYRIADDLEIGRNGRLTIEPGVQVFLDRDVNIEVDGGLVISGSKDSPVVFQAYDQDAWGGIEFNSAEGDATLNWAVFTEGGGDSGRIFGHSDSQPVLKVVDTEIVLEDCFFIDNEGKGIATHEGINRITNCVLARCDTGAEFRYSNTKINGLYTMFMPDEDDHIGDDDNDGLYFMSRSNARPEPHEIANVVIFGVEDDGIDFNNRQDAVISNTFVSHVYDKGISSTASVSLQVTYSSFSFCNDYGIAFKDDCEVELDNCTFFNNRVDIKAYNPDMGNREGKLSGYNLIFAQTLTELFDLDADARYSITYSISDTETIPGTGNLRGNPLLKDPANLDFSLTEDSPAIDAGNPDEPADPDGTRSDMGAYHFDYRTLVDIIPTEMDYQPRLNGQVYGELEFVELFNAGSRPVNLSGYRISGDIAYTFNTSFSWPPGSYLLLVKDRTQWDLPGVQIYQWTSGELPDPGGTIQLIPPSGEPVFSLNYQAGAPWPEPAVSHHYPLALKDVNLDYTRAQNWELSRVYGGTPGQANDAVPDLDLVLNELMPDNQGAVADPTDNHPDWIELYNAGDKPVNLAGLCLSNDPAAPDKWVIESDDYDETTLAPGAFALLWARGMGATDWTDLGFFLPDETGQVLLGFPGPNGVFLLDQIGYTAMETDLSFGRFPDGSGSWSITSVPTPGAANRQAFDEVVEGLFVNEFLARNASVYPDENGTYSDWIEIYNATHQAIDLAGLYLSDQLSEPLSYRIPHGHPELTTIPALGYLVFRADARPEIGPLHAGFQLASNGETVTLAQLFNGQVHILDHIAYDVQMTDVSFGRFPDASDQLEYFNNPTPGARNSSNSVFAADGNPALPVRIFPNPVSDRLIVWLGESAGESPKVSLVSASGQRVKVLQESQPSAVFEQQIIQDSLFGFPSGIYYLLIEYSEQRIMEKFLLLR